MVRIMELYSNENRALKVIGMEPCYHLLLHLHENIPGKFRFSLFNFASARKMQCLRIRISRHRHNHVQTSTRFSWTDSESWIGDAREEMAIPTSMVMHSSFMIDPDVMRLYGDFVDFQPADHTVKILYTNNPMK